MGPKTIAKLKKKYEELKATELLKEEYPQLTGSYEIDKQQWLELNKRKKK